MNKRIGLAIVLGIVSACRLYTPALAGVGVVPMSLDREVQDSDVIAIGQLLGTNGSPGSVSSEGNVGEASKSVPKYLFQIESSIKGDINGNISVPVGSLTPAWCGGSLPEIATGNQYLLLLTSNANGQWLPTDDCVPFIEVGSQASSGLNQIGTAQSEVVRILADSMRNVRLRSTCAYPCVSI